MKKTIQMPIRPAKIQASPTGKVYLEIQEMLQNGHSPRVIAYTLEVPLTWVYDVYEELEDYNVW